MTADAITVEFSQSQDERCLATRERSGGPIVRDRRLFFGAFWRPSLVPEMGSRRPTAGTPVPVREVRSMFVASSDRRSKGGTLNSPVR